MTQQFAVVGATQGDGVGQPPVFGTTDQLQVRYDASSNSYQVLVPGEQSWGTVSPDKTTSDTFHTSTGSAAIRFLSDGYQYSRLLWWFDGASIGIEGVGVATPGGDVPVTGSANYAGQIYGRTTETHSGDDVFISGAIGLSFNFSSGTLSGSISPILHDEIFDHSLGTISFRDPVYSLGSNQFSGSFDTNFSGLNSFSGFFTGPHAEEAIGNFALPYQSPIDSQVYQASGAFVAKH
jgi:hypothetical protein